MRKKVKFIYIYLIFALLMMVVAPMQLSYRAKANEKGTITGTAVNIRQSPNGTIITTLSYGHELDIIDMTSEAEWYQVSTMVDGNTITGWVHNSLVRIQSATGGTEVDPNSDFEAYMAAQGFPESYKPYLRTIHNAHPSWVLRAKQTGVNWGTLVSNEVCKSGRPIKNTIQCTSSNPHYNWRSTAVSYSFRTDTWRPADGANWFGASDAIVTYYLDPRTYLYDNYLFVFESLAYNEGVSTEAGVEAILNGTFMSHTVPAGESETYAQIIMRAGAESGVSPYHLAGRIKQEMGSTAGVAANGSHASYPGIYNFYNIGAVDTPNGSPVKKGIEWAADVKYEGTYGRPWNTPSKSIIGGAKWLGEGYINKGQNTLYTQKFNVTNEASGLYSHQYMTNVQAPSTECISNYNAYKQVGLLDTAIVFEIPVYYNLPEAASVKPPDSGNPNNWLNLLSVGGTTTSVDYNTEYVYSFDGGTGSVAVSATAVNSKATVYGAGTYNLNPGENIVYIGVRAQNGAVRNYTIKLVREDAGAGTTTLNQPLSGGESIPSAGGNDTPPADGQAGYITGTSVYFRESPNGRKITDANGTSITLTYGYSLVIIDTSDAEWYKVSLTYAGQQYQGYVSSAYVASGSLGETPSVAPPVVKGDLNGDGNISALDIVRIQRMIVGLDAVDMTADLNGDGQITALDIIKIQRHIVGLESLY